MDYRLDLCDACTQANRGYDRGRPGHREAQDPCAAAETAIRHLLEEVDGDRTEAVAVEIEAVRRIAAEVERAHLNLAKLPRRA